MLDTPGLNAIGAEPELTLSLLPSAHATVFILGADTGVTKSDLAIWRDHLGAHAPTRFVVLNKIDALDDPLATLEQVEAQIAQQQRETARTLGVPIAARVPAVGARRRSPRASTATTMALNESRLPLLEAALGAQLLPQRRQVLEQVVQEGAQQIESHVARQLGDQRRQLAEQTLELRGLRGKNSAKVRLMLKRVEAETAEFEQCTTLLQAMRSVHARMLKDMLVDLSSDRLRDEVAEMQASMGVGVPQPRRAQGLRRAVRAAARAARRRRSAATARSARCSARRSRASTPSSASAWRSASRSTSTASRASCS